LRDRRRNSSILNLGCFRGADCDTDNYLVIAKVWERLSVNKRAAQNFYVEIFNLREVSWDWIDLAQDRDRWWTLVVNALMNIRVPHNGGNFLTSCEPVSFSQKTLLH